MTADAPIWTRPNPREQQEVFRLNLNYAATRLSAQAAIGEFQAVLTLQNGTRVNVTCHPAIGSVKLHIEGYSRPRTAEVSWQSIVTQLRTLGKPSTKPRPAIDPHKANLGNRLYKQRPSRVTQLRTHDGKVATLSLKDLTEEETLKIFAVLNGTT